MSVASDWRATRNVSKMQCKFVASSFSMLLTHIFFREKEFATYLQICSGQFLLGSPPL